jgi:hypothetical protein
MTKALHSTFVYCIIFKNSESLENQSPILLVVHLMKSYVSANDIWLQLQRHKITV